MQDDKDKKETQDENKTSTDESTVSRELTEEIDSGVESAMENVEKDRQERDKAEGKEPKKPEETNDLPPDEGQTGEDNTGSESPGNGDGKGDEDDSGSKKEDLVDDSLLERAVKVDIPLEEAKQYPNATMLGHVCDRLEALRDTTGDGEGKNADDDKGEETDPLAAIPDLDPEEYDENVVAGFKAMKDIIRQQQQTISGLETSGKGSEKSLFDSKVEGLGETFDKAFKASPEKLTALKEQYDVLAAGYKAAGKKIEQGEVFDQAVQITLSDIAAKAKDEAKGSKVRARSKQQISRPGGTKSTPTTDAFEDTASELDRKYFGEK